MKKIIELIKKLLGAGSMAEKVAELNELEVEVVKEKVAEVKAKVKKVTNKPAAPKASDKKK